METNSLSIPFVRDASYPVRPGNIVRPLVDGEPAFRRVCEAIDAARYSVWATITFMWASFAMPDGRGSAWHVLEHAAARGLDVRLIFWRPDPETETFKRNAFWGSPDHITMLESCCKNIRIRWDRAEPGFCQHQKSWLMDADEATGTVFLGGINLNPHSMVAPGHRGEGHNHDVYIELAGPSAVDVHHNFVQRWNEASERHLPDGRWGPGSETDLPFPASVPSRRGNAIVQMQRTMHSGRYTDGHPTPGGAAFTIATGERAIFEQYRIAIAAARRTIYIENQSVSVAEIVDDLRQALRRGAAWTWCWCCPPRKRFPRLWQPSMHSRISPWPGSPGRVPMVCASRSGFTRSSWWSMANGPRSVRAICTASRSSVMAR